MRTASVTVTTSEAAELVPLSQCPANVIISNIGDGEGAQGTILFSTEANIADTGAGIPIPFEAGQPIRTNRPVFGLALGENSKATVTYLSTRDEVAA